MQKEIEATFLSINKEDIRQKLKKSGFVIKVSEYLMRRKTFDMPSSSDNKKWGRVRQESDKVTMTIKEIRGATIHDVYELELVVDNFDTACLFFEACGIKAKAFQENMREVWELDGVQAMIDTWPGLNPFVEIEGKTEEIVKKISTDLGFDFAEATFGSIDLIYEKELGIEAKKIIDLPEITFSNVPKKNVA